MQKPSRETQTLLHSGNPFSKPVPLKEEKDGSDDRVTGSSTYTDIRAVSVGICKSRIRFSTLLCLAPQFASDQCL